MKNTNKILVVTDNFLLFSKITKILKNEFPDLVNLFDFKRSKISSQKKLYTEGINVLEEIDVKKNCNFIIENYNTVISLHCKQIFPTELINNVLCVNIHPGYNPYNRGWYPQVFAIIGKMKLGATIHIMDSEIDHGKIIARKEVEIEKWHTSKEAYENVLDAELELFRKNIRNIVNNNFTVILPEIEGEYHSIADYKNLCELNLDEYLTVQQVLDKLRALSHGDYNNAYFYDNKGNKIFVKINLIKE